MVLISHAPISVLTAELLISPVVGFATHMDTLSRELRNSVAQTDGVYVVIFATATVAEVSNTGRCEGGDVEQAVTAIKSWPCEDLLTQRFLQDRQGKAKEAND